MGPSCFNGRAVCAPKQQTRRWQRHLFRDGLPDENLDYPKCPKLNDQLWLSSPS